VISLPSGVAVGSPGVKESGSVVEVISTALNAVAVAVRLDTGKVQLISNVGIVFVGKAAGFATLQAIAITRTITRKRNKDFLDGLLL
jgi:hypothetical protein